MSARERLRRARLGKHDSTAGARFTAVLAETAFHAKSLDEPVNKYSDHVMAVGDMIADDKPGQDKDLELVELASWVRDVLDTMPLSDIERAIVDLHLMRGYSLVEVGKRVNRSRERIRQIKELLMPKLAARFASEPEALHLAF
jgi:DNA-directed RNA polymerase sigma subunit (sigma70/sigma32)